MNRPAQILMNEHRVIEQVLDCLEKMAERARGDGALAIEDARAAATFFRTFADACHHGKEEDLLFPLLEQKNGLTPTEGPTAVMRMEHDKGRALVGSMIEATDAYEAAEGAEGGALAAGDFARAADEFIYLLRGHIQKEDTCLFPIAEDLLSAGEFAGLEASFEAFERDGMGAGVHEGMLREADRLARAWGVDAAAAGSGCCGH